MKNTSTYGLKLTQMAELFALGREDPDPLHEGDRYRDVADLLREQLTCSLPKGTIFCDVLVMTMKQQGCDTTRLEGQSLGDVLLNNRADIDTLRALKEGAKILAANLDSQVETALATCLYFAALASALIFHDRKLTRHSDTKLQESFSMMIEKHWMTPELVPLFSQAQNLCQGRRNGP